MFGLSRTEVKDIINVIRSSKINEIKEFGNKSSSLSNICIYSKENLWIRNDCNDNLKQRNERYHENC